ncbi:PCOLCE [Branchiostoma lanceolatum]|uniref:PCOLCE protein n=1 Tax=Branchiostoma lanceolatum TaxID=7740 RepID=A0A8K0ERV5_BRALA|nr:PCOLCE [Branchiostoma lanceolatum]
MDWKTMTGILLLASLSFCQSLEHHHAGLAKRDANECGGAIYGGSGTVSSPGFPQKYPDKQRCTWTIKAPPGSFIEVTFGSLVIEQNTDEKCDYDYLNITMDGTKNFGPYCNSNKPPNTRLVGTLFEITFVSDDTVGKQGFLLLYSTTKTPHEHGQETNQNEEGCTAERLKAGSGVITTPRYPLQYPVKTNCTWTIEAESDKNAFIQMEVFDVEVSDNCSYDYMTIKVDGNWTLGPYCNKILPPKARINGSKFEIFFNSDDEIVGLGFLLVYNSYIIDQGHLTTSNPGGADNYTGAPTEWVYTEEDDTTEAPPPDNPPTPEPPTTEDAVSENVSMTSLDNRTAMTSPAGTVRTTGGNVTDSDDGLPDKVQSPGDTNVGGVVAGITIPLLLIVGAAVVITRLFMKGQSPGQGPRRHTRQKAQDDKNNPPSSDVQTEDGSDVQVEDIDQAPKQENTEGDKEEEAVPEAAGGEADPTDNQAPTAAASAAAEEPATGEKSETNDGAATGEKSDAAATAANQPTANPTYEGAIPVAPANPTYEGAIPVAPANPTCGEDTPVAPANPTYEEATPVAPANPTYEEATPVAPANPTYEEAAPVATPADITYEEATPVAPANSTYEEATPVRGQITVKPMDDDSGEAADPDPETPNPAAEPQQLASTNQPSEPNDTAEPSETAPPGDDSGPHDEQQPGTSYASSQQDVYY